MSAGTRRPERLTLPGGREVVLGWGEVGREQDSTLSPLEREDRAVALLRVAGFGPGGRALTAG